MAFTPILVADTSYGVAAGAGQDPTLSRYRTNGQRSDSVAINRRRLFRNGADLYTILFDSHGDENDNLSPRYFQNTWEAYKSTDEGATWAPVDFNNRISGGFADLFSNGDDAVVQIGTKLWVIFDFGEHDSGNFILQFERIHVSYFDMATDTWGSTVTTGPERIPGSLTLDAQPLTCDACYRGSDEIVVLHRETDETQSPQRVLYSIFNVSSGTWTSLDQVAFSSGTAYDIYPNSCVFDGTYTHFFCESGRVVTSTPSKLHRTLTGSTLGTVGDMFASYPGSAPVLTSYAQAYPDYPIVFDGEVIVVQTYRGYDARYTSLTWQTLIMHAPAATAAPTWTCADIGANTWDAANSFDAAGESGASVLVESGGTLYCVTPGAVFGGTGYTPTTGQYYIHGQTYSGGGSWGAPVEFWSWRDAYGGTGVFTVNELYKLCAIGDLTGSGLRGIGIAASDLGYPRPDISIYQDSVYWIRTEATSCCCSNFAF